MAFFGQNPEVVKFGMVAEATDFTLETGTAVPVVLTSGADVSYSSTITPDPTRSGAGRTIDAAVELRSADLSVPMVARYENCRARLGAAMRIAFPGSEVSIVGSGNITIVTDGTHKDGSTGTQIQVADTSSFDTIITYNTFTSTNGGTESFMFRSTGFAASENNGWREAKAVWKDGTTSYIDIAPGWVSGATGFLGEAMTAATLQTPTMRFGYGVYEIGDENGTLTSYTALFKFSQMSTNGIWGHTFGNFATGFEFSYSGKGISTWTFPHLGHAPDPPNAAADPTSAGFAADPTRHKMLNAADRLTYCAIVPAAGPIILSDVNLTGSSMSLTSSSNGIDDTSGSTNRCGVEPGSFALEGSVDYRHVDSSTVDKMAELGAESTAAFAPLWYLFTDPDGQFVSLKANNGVWGLGGTNPSSSTGSMSFTGIEFSHTGPLVTYQEFSG